MSLFSGLLLVIFACGRASGPPASSTAQSVAGGRESAPAVTPPPYDPAIPRFIVPPERAIMTVTIRATEKSFAGSTQLVQDKTTTLLESVNAGSGCMATMIDYLQPVQPLGKYLRPDAKQYTSQMVVELDISLTGMTDIGDRIQRLDDCLGRIPELIEDKDGDDEAIAMTLSSVVPTLRDATVHRDALLQERFKALEEVAAAAQPPGQFQSSRTVCTSDGTVRIISHQLSGIELDVDFDCDQNPGDSNGPDKEVQEAQG